VKASLNGKVAVVTGASMGIGEAVAKLLAEAGATVVLSSRDSGRVEAARARIGLPQQTLALACDVRNREEIDRLLALTLHNFGRVDLWVNNAGHGLRDTVAAMDMAACHEMFETNLFGALNGMQAAMAAMARQGFGTIVNIASVAGHIPLALGGAYSGTKFALIALGKAARMELRGTGIEVMTVSPGYVDTNFSRNLVIGRSNLGLATPIHGTSAGRVARALLRGYLKHKREVVVPGYYRLFIFLYHLCPGFVEWAMARMAKKLDP
jgi:short-subunit dehydrogenase